MNRVCLIEQFFSFHYIFVNFIFLFTVEFFNFFHLVLIKKILFPILQWGNKLWMKKTNRAWKICGISLVRLLFWDPFCFSFELTVTILKYSSIGKFKKKQQKEAEERSNNNNNNNNKTFYLLNGLLEMYFFKSHRPKINNLKPWHCLNTYFIVNLRSVRNSIMYFILF